jgi:predicted MFS family arabinose efflux permease
VARPPRRTPRGLLPLRHRGFRYLVTGQLASNIGDGCYAVALPWYVLAHHGGPLLLSVVLAAYGIPRVALMIVGGHASDRWRPWTVMMGADAVRALAVAGLAVAVLAGPARAAILVPIAVVIGAGEGLFLPGSFAIIPSLLPDDDLQAGNALASSGTELAGLIGPAVGGAVVAAAGPAAAFVVDAATFGLSALTLAGIRTAQRPAAVAAAAADPAAQQATDEAEAALEPGLPLTLRGFLRSQRVLQIILVITLAANLGLGGMSEIALPALVRGPFHSGAAGYGGLVAVFGLGALVGALAAGQISATRRPVFFASWILLAAAIPVAVVPYVGSLVAVGAVLAVFGALLSFGNVITITVLQRWAPPQLLGRLMSVVLTASFGTFPVSVLIGGLVVRNFGPAPFFPATAAALFLAVAAGLTQQSWRDFGATPTTPTAAAPPPDHSEPAAPAAVPDPRPAAPAPPAISPTDLPAPVATERNR